MEKNQHKIKLFLCTIFSLLAIVILIDYTAPGKVINGKIIDVKKDRQQYYNAANNHHYSYKVTTSKHQFIVSEEFVELDIENKKIQYSMSRIFNKVNWYKLTSSNNKSFNSLRIMSGLVIPFISLISIFIAFRFKKDIGILIFVLQVLLLTDFIFLLL